MLSAQSRCDARTDRAHRAQGRQAALELLLRLTCINDEGRHTRQRISREEAVLLASGGKHADGERVVQMLSGERRADAPGSHAHTGVLRLITISTEHERQYVDLIHETLLRDRGRTRTPASASATGPPCTTTSKTTATVTFIASNCASRPSAGRAAGPDPTLAPGVSGSWAVLAAACPADSAEARFLSSSRWARRAAVLAGLADQLWANPITGRRRTNCRWSPSSPCNAFASSDTRRFRFGANPPGALEMGEHDDAFLKDHRQKYFRNFGVPGTAIEIERGFQLGGSGSPMTVRLLRVASTARGQSRAEVPDYRQRGWQSTGRKHQLARANDYAQWLVKQGKIAACQPRG